MTHYNKQREKSNIKIKSDVDDSLNMEEFPEFKLSKNMIKNIQKLLDDTVQIPEEMYDFVKVLDKSAESGKYPANNWLEPNGMSCEPRAMYASMFRHLAEANCGSIEDKDSGLHPLLHLATGALMMYTRWKKGIDYKKD